jgi:hypothetical protein
LADQDAITAEYSVSGYECHDGAHDVDPRRPGNLKAEHARDQQPLEHP